MSKSKNRVVGITLGDPAGIGPEVVSKALAQSAIRELADFVIIGNQPVYEQYSIKKFKNCKFIDTDSPQAQEIKPGRPNRESAVASLKYLQCGIDLLKKSQITSLVTAPLSKEAVSSIGKKFHGHTEYLAEAFNVKKYGMMFVADDLRTILVTRHIPLKDVSSLISVNNIYETIQLGHQALKEFFKIENPRIAVCGLNPHAGEGGTIGDEEISKILPAIQQARHQGILVEGPFAADTLFSPITAKKYDTILALYHDQGLIPLKTLHFQNLVNLTIGLPFVRTSPAHGTAFNIAGKNTADPSSMREAIKLAATLSK
ncbi:MAG: 4-hydroxythreonine-4-phosphate dehydrogenase PdxA [Candidatus Omnitrophota bacterium]